MVWQNTQKLPTWGRSLNSAVARRWAIFVLIWKNTQKLPTFKKSQKCHLVGQFLCQFGKTHNNCPLQKMSEIPFCWAIFVSIWKNTQILPTSKLYCTLPTCMHAARQIHEARTLERTLTCHIHAACTLPHIAAARMLLQTLCTSILWFLMLHAHYMPHCCRHGYCCRTLSFITEKSAGMSYSDNQQYDYIILIILRNLPDGPHQVYE